MGRTRSHLILVADRGRSLVPPEQTVFADENTAVIGSSTGAEVLRLIRERKPTLLIMGPDLEDMTALSLCRRIRRDPTLPRVAILLVASPAEHARVEKLLDLAVNDVIYRPISALEFDRKVRRMLRVPPRAMLRVLVQIRTPASGEGFLTLGRTRNLSEGGMMLETDRELEKGQTLSLRFPLAVGAAEIQAIAEVVRRERSLFGHACGIRFVELADKDRRAIGELVRDRAEAEDDES